MNKTVIGAIAVVVLAAGGWYFYSQKGATGSAMMAGNSPTQQMSMKELVALGKTEKCDFSEPQSKTAATIYIADGKVRGDFTSQSPAGNVSGHMISDGTTVNTWMDGMTQGFKSSFAMTGQKSGTDSQKGLDPEKKSDYKCESWSKDDSKFQLPAGITFTDVSAMMQGGAPGSGASAGTSAAPVGTRNQCAMCDKAPAPQRSQCRQALNCK